MTIEMMPIRSTLPRIAFMSAKKRAEAQILPEAGPGKDGLDENRAVKQAAIGECHDGQKLHPDIAEGVAPDDGALAEALGFRRQRHIPAEAVPA